MTLRLVHTALAWLGDQSLLRWGAISLAVVALSLLLMQSEQTSTPGDAEALRGPDEPDGFVVGGTYRSFDEQGHLSTRIDSQRAEQFDDEELIIMEYPRGVIFERDSLNPWNLSARRGDYSMANETLELIDSVRITRETEERGQARLATTRLTLDNRQRIVHTEAPVTLSDDFSETDAIGMRGWIDERIVELKSDVRGQYER